MSTDRNYKCRDVEMLLASQTIVISLNDNLEELSLIRTSWTAEYVSTLKTRINNAIENFLGLDKKKAQRMATTHLQSLMQAAHRNIFFLKTQIEVDFGDEAKEILNNLGYYIDAEKLRNHNQEAMIQMLYAFKNGMTDELKTQITAKGTNPSLIEKIISYADQIKEADINQEHLKETSRELSQEALNEFNSIYEIIIGICKIAASYYYNDPLKKDQFTFSNIVSNMSSGED